MSQKSGQYEVTASPRSLADRTSARPSARHSTRAIPKRVQAQMATVTTTSLCFDFAMAREDPEGPGSNPGRVETDVGACVCAFVALARVFLLVSIMTVHVRCYAVSVSRSKVRCGSEAARSRSTCR